MLLLLLAVNDINAAQGPEDCDGLNKMHSAQDLSKLQIYGEWLLVWATSNQPGHLLGGAINVTMKYELLPDHKTILYTDRTFGHSEYTLQMSRPSDPSEAEKHLLHVDYFIMGDRKNSQNGRVDFYERCSDCLVMEHRLGAEDVSFGHFLSVYRKMGSPMDGELLKAFHRDYEILAECLGLPHDKPYIYEPLKKGPEDCDGLNKMHSAQDLSKLQIYGEWLLVWGTSNQPGHLLGGAINVTMKYELLPDHKTILYTDRTFGHSEYTLQMSRPSDPSEAEKHLLHVDYFIMGDRKNSQNGRVDFYESCSDCLVMEHRLGAEDVSFGHFLFVYRKMGSPMDSELLKASHSDYEILAKCLGLPHGEPYIYEPQRLLVSILV